MRIVNDAQNLARCRRIELHATGNKDALKAMDDALFGNAEGLGAGNGGKRIGHVELDGRGNHDVTRKARRADRGDHAAIAVANGQRAHVGASIGQRERHRALAAGRRLEHAVDVVHIEVDHGKAALRKNLELAGKVILERGVLDRRDMVLTDIGKGAHFKVNLARTLVFEALARRLHDQPRSARLGGMCDTRLQKEGLGGR